MMTFRALVCMNLAVLFFGSPVFASESEDVAQLCKDVRASVEFFKWKIEACNPAVHWKVGGRSVSGRPLIYAEFGDPKSTNTTLVFSAVHGDEITPIFFGIEMVNWMLTHSQELGGVHVVVAPIVNPDGFFKKPRTRMNARGVDINRNFDTADWNKMALKAWKGRFHSDPRRFPGNTPRSEPETVFQEELIKKIKPQKILSVHSPLNFTDYDGPSQLSLAKFSTQYVHECMKLRQRLKAVSGGFFPGSLGNYAGRQLGIPTITLELPSSDAKSAETYWKKFSGGIKTMIQFVVPGYTAQSTSK